MSDIQVGDRFRVTGDMYSHSIFSEGDHKAIRVGPYRDESIVVMVMDDNEYGFLSSQVEKVEPLREFAVGDKVLVRCDDYGDTHTMVGTVLAVDEHDDILPYRIETSDSGDWGDWFAASEVHAVEERKDHTELVDEADMLIFAYSITEPDGYTGKVLKRLRDALVEESYREGK